VGTIGTMGPSKRFRTPRCPENEGRNSMPYTRRRVGALALVAAMTIAAMLVVACTANYGAPRGNGSGRTGSQAAAPRTSGTEQTQGETSSSNVPTLEIRESDAQGAYDRIAGQASGSMSYPESFALCTSAAGLAGAGIIGVADVKLDGRPAIAFAVTSPSDIHRAELIVVNAICGPRPSGVLLRVEVTRH